MPKETSGTMSSSCARISSTLLSLDVFKPFSLGGTEGKAWIVEEEVGGRVDGLGGLGLLLAGCVVLAREGMAGDELLAAKRLAFDCGGDGRFAKVLGFASSRMSPLAARFIMRWYLQHVKVVV